MGSTKIRSNMWEKKNEQFFVNRPHPTNVQKSEKYLIKVLRVLVLELVTNPADTLRMHRFHHSTTVEVQFFLCIYALPNRKGLMVTYHGLGFPSRRYRRRRYRTVYRM